MSFLSSPTLLVGEPTYASALFNLCSFLSLLPCVLKTETGKYSQRDNNRQHKENLT